MKQLTRAKVTTVTIFPKLEAVSTKVDSLSVAHVGVESQENQENVTITQNGTNIKIAVNGELNSFASTEIEQGVGKWVALEIATGLDDISKATYNGAPLTEKDIADAESLGMPAGSFVLWVKAEKLPKVFTVGGENRTEVTYTVSLSE